MCLACSGGDKAAVATAGSIQDSEVTKEKRAADAERNWYQEQVAPTPTPVVMRNVYQTSFPAAVYDQSAAAGGEK